LNGETKIIVLGYLPFNLIITSPDKQNLHLRFKIQ
jgi:hypothetical protein